MTAREPGSEVQRRSDSYGFQWLVVRDPDFEDLVTAVHLDRLRARMRKGFG